MPRRILVLNERDPTHPLAGGAETHIYEIFSRLAARGHEITHLAASYKGCKRDEVVRGVRVVRLANRHLYYSMVPRAARRIAREGCDVVVDTLNKLPLLSPWYMPVPCMAIVHHLFGTTAFQQVAFPIALVTWLSEKLIPIAYRGVPMLAISPSTRDDLVTRGVDPARIGVVAPGVDPTLYQAPETPSAQEPIVAWIGRLEPYKRADTIIDAMELVRRSVPDARLIIVGAGGARQDLERRASEKGLANAVHNEKKYFLSEEIFSFEPFALAVARGDADFQLVADRALSQLNRSGQIGAIYRKWFSRFGAKPPLVLKALYKLNATPE